MLKTNLSIIIVAYFLLSGLRLYAQPLPALKVSANKHYLMTENGEPFFWLGDTGWLLFAKLNIQEANRYLQDRKDKGFNVIQAMVLHTLSAVNAYGDTALINNNVATPNIQPGNSPADSLQYDYWDHVEMIVDMAAEKGLYMGLVPVWGTNVKMGGVSRDQAITYASWLGDRFRNKPNIIWLNGGDIKGSDSINTWKAIGNTLRKHDPNHLITFHPFGRTTSSDWFHDEPWLDFNMFQSGHRSYQQDTARSEHRFGPDNWKFVELDYYKKPTKPTLEGEPSYEAIPYGLHDTSSTNPRWDYNDVRRYGYWAIFAGAAGYTYGHNSVMQMHKPTDVGSAYGSKMYWYTALDQPGAIQMYHLKELLLSRPYFERVPDQSMIAGNPGLKYNHLVATHGKNYAFVYTYNGRIFKLNMGKIAGSRVSASWFNPRNGRIQKLGVFSNSGTHTFNPPGKQQEGNDWVLILDKI